jgi:16S rRNA (guanine966-N2)-methyltransferase
MAGLLRITGGSLCGRRLRVPPGDNVRPTLDRVREALFSSLQSVIGGAAFLDLFAGSGAVGLEASSRGAGLVCWVEQDRRVFTTLKDNVGTLLGGGAAGECRCQDVFAFCRGWRAERGFDVIFADPPYALRDGVAGLAGKLLELLSGERHPLVAPGGLLVLEQGARETVPVAAGWELIRERDYGRTCLRTYRKKETAA